MEIVMEKYIKKDIEKIQDNLFTKVVDKLNEKHTKNQQTYTFKLNNRVFGLNCALFLRMYDCSKRSSAVRCVGRGLGALSGQLAGFRGGLGRL